jgi:hypothetical protein
MTAINVVALPTVGRSLRLGKGGESVRSGQLLFREEPLLQWSLSDSANDHIDGLGIYILFYYICILLYLCIVLLLLQV